MYIQLQYTVTIYSYNIQYTMYNIQIQYTLYIIQIQYTVTIYRYNIQLQYTGTMCVQFEHIYRDSMFDV